MQERFYWRRHGDDDDFCVGGIEASCLTLKSRKHDPEAEMDTHRVSCITCDADFEH